MATTIARVSTDMASKCEFCREHIDGSRDLRKASITTYKHTAASCATSDKRRLKAVMGSHGKQLWQSCRLPKPRLSHQSQRTVRLSTVALTNPSRYPERHPAGPHAALDVAATLRRPGAALGQ